MWERCATCGRPVSSAGSRTFSPPLSSARPAHPPGWPVHSRNAPWRRRGCRAGAAARTQQLAGSETAEPRKEEGVVLAGAGLERALWCVLQAPVQPADPAVVQTARGGSRAPRMCWHALVALSSTDRNTVRCRRRRANIQPGPARLPCHWLGAAAHAATLTLAPPSTRHRMAASYAGSKVYDYVAAIVHWNAHTQPRMLLRGLHRAFTSGPRIWSPGGWPPRAQCRACSAPQTDSPDVAARARAGGL
jgi:hypothetical protein